jgi:hypothetical protein
MTLKPQNFMGFFKESKDVEEKRTRSYEGLTK